MRFLISTRIWIRLALCLMRHSAFTVLSGWDVAFCHKIASQQERKRLSIDPVGFDAGFSYGLCPQRVAELHLNSFIFEFVVDANPEVCGRFYDGFDVVVSTDFARVTRLEAPSQSLSNRSSCMTRPLSFMRAA